MQLTGFDGKLALVTGAAGGIGRAVVAALVAAGARVIATDLTVPEAPGAAATFALDVRDYQAVADLVDQIESQYGPISLLASVAGVLATGTVSQTSPEAWRQVFAVNTDGVFHLCQAVSGRMAARRSGAIVVVSSNAAGVPRHGMAAYAASKAATTMFTRCLGLELAPLGVRANIVAPGSTLTPMQTGMWADESGAARVIAGIPDEFKPGIPLGKLATPEDIAASVMFLLSDQAGHITMADLYVDGGATQRA